MKNTLLSATGILILIMAIVLGICASAPCARAEESSNLTEIKKEAEKGNVNTQLELGLIYNDGRGVPQDPHQAITWFKKAAEQGSYKAQYYLGFIYSLGEDIPKDPTQAYVWFSLAAAQGDEASTKGRDFAAEELTPEQLDKAQAMVSGLQAKIDGKKK